MKTTFYLLNTSKSHVISFTPQKHITSMSISINNVDIKEQCRAVFLGVTFDQHLRFSQQVESVIALLKQNRHWFD